MKFCSNCGKEILNESKYCSNCGKEIIVKEEKNIPNEPAQDVKVDTTQVKQSNPLAITGFVISLVSLLCCGGTSWLGLIFSIIGLVESKKKNNAGKGLAIAGIIISAILFVLLVILYAFSIGTSITDLLNETNFTGNFY